MATKKPSAKQIAARKLFAERARAGTLGGKKNYEKSYSKNPAPRKRNPAVKYKDQAKGKNDGASPGGNYTVMYSIHNADRPSYHGFAYMSKKEDAIETAQEASDRTGLQLAVSRVIVWAEAK